MNDLFDSRTRTRTWTRTRTRAHVIRKLYAVAAAVRAYCDAEICKYIKMCHHHHFLMRHFTFWHDSVWKKNKRCILFFFMCLFSPSTSTVCDKVTRAIRTSFSYLYFDDFIFLSLACWESFIAAINTVSNRNGWNNSATKSGEYKICSIWARSNGWCAVMRSICICMSDVLPFLFGFFRSSVPYISYRLWHIHSQSEIITMR